MSWLSDLFDRIRRKPFPDPRPKPKTKPFLDLLNRLRAEHHLTLLTLDVGLTLAALDHATAMAEASQLDHHIAGERSVSGRIRFRGYSYMAYAENLCEGAATEQAAFNAWCNSPVHLENMLGPYEDFGIAVFPDADGSQFWCLVLAR